MARDGWTQTTLLPPEAVEAVLRLGVVGATDHVQLQVEVRDATDGTLLELWSRPSASLADLDAVVARAVAELRELTRKHVAPF